MDGRYSTCDFNANEKLYRGFDKNDLDENTYLIQANSIRFPDFSCNWSRFSTPDRIRERENGRPTDGCYSFTVEVSRYKNIATPCHDPEENNYSHTEVRQLKPDEDIYFEPPRNRRLESRWAKNNRLEYRQSIVENLIIELEALA